MISGNIIKSYLKPVKLTRLLTEAGFELTEGKDFQTDLTNDNGLPVLCGADNLREYKCIFDEGVARKNPLIFAADNKMNSKDYWMPEVSDCIIHPGMSSILMKNIINAGLKRFSNIRNELNADNDNKDFNGTANLLPEEGQIAENNHLQNIFDLLNDGICFADAAGNIKFCNRKFIQLIGLNEKNSEKYCRINDLFIGSGLSKYNYLERINNGAGNFSELMLTGSSEKEEKYIVADWIILNPEHYPIAEVLVLLTDVTQWKKTEISLRDREHRLKSILGSTPAGICVLSGTVIKEVNRMFTHLTGYTVMEINRKDISMFFTTGSEFEKFKNKISHSAGENKSVITETRWKRKNGRVFDVLIYAAGFDSVYFPMGLTLSVMDITERKKNELEQSKLTAIIDNNSDFIGIASLAGDVQYVNKSGRKLVGLSENEEVTEKNILDFVPADQREWLGNHIMSEMFEKGSVSGEGYLKNIKNDKIIEIDFTVFLIKMIESDIPNYMAVILRDITERRNAEKKIKQYQNHLENLVAERTKKLEQVNRELKEKINLSRLAEEKLENQLNLLRTFIDTFPSPAYVKDRKNRYLAVNRAFEHFLGKSRDEILGLNLKDVSEKYSRILADDVTSDDAERLTKIEEFEIESGTGKKRFYLSHKAKYSRMDGSYGGIVGTFIDITSQKELQAKIKQSLDREKELSNMKSSFISTASHEFRTPLTTIMSSSDLLTLISRENNEKKFFNHIEKIQTSVDYMTSLLDDVLLISKAETGKIEFVPEKVNFRLLCKNIIDEVKNQATDKHKFRFEYEPEQTMFHLDEKLVKHIIINLLSNSIKYSLEGGEIGLKIKKDLTSLRIFISDDGIGIPEADQKNLFESFHRGSNVSNIPGTGLGLSIVKRSVELHNGSIEFTSSEGEGTTFIISLPG